MSCRLTSDSSISGLAGFAFLNDLHWPRAATPPARIVPSGRSSRKTVCSQILGVEGHRLYHEIQMAVRRRISSVSRRAGVACFVDLAMPPAPMVDWISQGLWRGPTTRLMVTASAAHYTLHRLGPAPRLRIWLAFPNKAVLVSRSSWPTRTAVTFAPGACLGKRMSFKTPADPRNHTESLRSLAFPQSRSDRSDERGWPSASSSSITLENTGRPLKEGH